MIIKTTMNSSKKNPTCPSDEIAQLREEQQEILKEIELKIKRNEYPTTN